VLDAAASNIDGFLSRDTCVSSTLLNRCIWYKEIYNHLEKPKLQEVFLSKMYSILTLKHVLDAPASNTDGFLSRDTCVFNSAE
jgi:hypothetical protein